MDQDRNHLAGNRNGFPGPAIGAAHIQRTCPVQLRLAFQFAAQFRARIVALEFAGLSSAASFGIAQPCRLQYAALLPIFDRMSGAYLRPAAGIYPGTGLLNGRKPHSALDAVAWPLLKMS